MNKDSIIADVGCLLVGLLSLFGIVSLIAGISHFTYDPTMGLFMIGWPLVFWSIVFINQNRKDKAIQEKVRALKHEQEILEKQKDEERSATASRIEMYGRQYAAKKEEIEKQSAVYREKYIAFHSQEYALKMSSSETLNRIAGQLFLLYKKRIDNADRNEYIEIIEIVMKLVVDEYEISYEFWQRGTIRPQQKNKAAFSFKAFGMPFLTKEEERKGIIQAIASMIQIRLLEDYADCGDAMPTVSVVYEESTRVLLIFSQNNPAFSDDK